MTSNSGNAERIAKALDPKATRLPDGSWSCCCPAHHDRDPSLSLDWKDGKLVWHCWAGCSQADVQAELKRRGLLGKPNGSTYEHKPKAKADQGSDWCPILPVPDGTPDPAFTHPAHGTPSATWCYRDESNEILLHVARFDPPGRRLRRRARLVARHLGRGERTKGAHAARGMAGSDYRGCHRGRPQYSRG